MLRQSQVPGPSNIFDIFNSARISIMILGSAPLEIFCNSLTVNFSDKRNSMINCKSVIKLSSNMKLNLAQPLIGMDLEECYIVTGLELIYRFNIHFERFIVIFNIFLSDYMLFPLRLRRMSGRMRRLYQKLIPPISRMSLR